MISLSIGGINSLYNSAYRFYNTSNTLSHFELVHHSMTELYQSRHDSSTDPYKRTVYMRNSYKRSAPSGGILFLSEREARPVTPSLSRGRASTSTALPVHRARICKPFQESRHRFPAWRAGTTTLLVVPARHATWAGEIESSESIPGLLKRLQIRAPVMGKQCWKRVLRWPVSYILGATNIAQKEHLCKSGGLMTIVCQCTRM